MAYLCTHAYRPTEYRQISSMPDEQCTSCMCDSECPFVCTVHMYIYIYIYTHTHTHTDREREMCKLQSTFRYECLHLWFLTSSTRHSHPRLAICKQMTKRQRASQPVRKAGRPAGRQARQTGNDRHSHLCSIISKAFLVAPVHSDGGTEGKLNLDRTPYAGTTTLSSRGLWTMVHGAAELFFAVWVAGCSASSQRLF